MPAKSYPLGFNCPNCGKNYGSKQLFIQKNRDRTKTKRALSKRNEIDRKQKPKRPDFRPVEYSLFDTIISVHETRWLVLVSKSLENPQFNAMLKSMSNSERQKLIDVIENTSSHIKARMESEHKDRNQEEKGANTYERWDVIVRIDQDYWVYQLMKRIAAPVIMVNEEKGKKYKDKKVMIKWNPIKAIKKYRKLGDPFRHIDFDMNFYVRVVAKYPSVLAYLYEENRYPLMKKTFDIINKYRNQFIPPICQ
jgi:hypothetical protein